MIKVHVHVHTVGNSVSRSWYWGVWVMAHRARQPDRSALAFMGATRAHRPAGLAKTIWLDLVISSFLSPPLLQLDIICATSLLLPSWDRKRWYISSDSNFSQRSPWWMSPPPSFSAALHWLRVDGFDPSSPEPDRSRQCWIRFSFSFILGPYIDLVFPVSLPSGIETNQSFKVNLFKPRLALAQIGSG